MIRIVRQKIVNIFVLLPLFVLSGLVIAGSLTLVIKSDFEKPFPDILCTLACLASILTPLSFMGMTADVSNLLYVLGLYGAPSLIFVSLIVRIFGGAENRRKRSRLVNLNLALLVLCILVSFAFSWFSVFSEIGV